MRILHLLASPVFSGPAENVALLAVAQRELGHEVTVAVDAKRGPPPFEEPARPRFEALGLLAPQGLELSVKSTPWAMLQDVRRLRRLEGIDVLHVHFSHDHFLARLGRPRGATLVRSIHARRSLHTGTPRADGFTVPTEALTRELPAGRVLVLPSLVDPAFAVPADRRALQRDLGLSPAAQGPFIGMVSTFQPSRRHLLGLAAFRRVWDAEPQARLILVGDGILEGELRAEVARLGLGDSVLFAGYQRGEAFVRWLQALDEVWILGLGNDESGRAAAQARRCGVPVVAVAEGGLPSMATVVVPAEAEAIRAASCALRSQVVGAEWKGASSNREIAASVMALYERASVRR